MWENDEVRRGRMKGRHRKRRSDPMGSSLSVMLTGTIRETSKAADGIALKGPDSGRDSTTQQVPVRQSLFKIHESH